MAWVKMSPCPEATLTSVKTTRAWPVDNGMNRAATLDEENKKDTVSEAVVFVSQYYYGVQIQIVQMQVRKHAA